jgi:hypothetical protein
MTKLVSKEKARTIKLFLMDKHTDSICLFMLLLTILMLTNF